MDALVGGVLEIDGGCVWLADGNGSRFPVIWPANTLGQTNPIEIVLPDGEIARPGDGLQGGGGYVRAARVVEGLGLEPFADECIQSGEAAVFISDDGKRSVLVDPAGTMVGEQPGRAISVGWQGAAVLRPDGSLVATNALLGDETFVNKVVEGEWSSVGGPLVPTTCPPLRTGTNRHLVRLADQLVVIASNGTATTLHDLDPSLAGATWSRAGDWVVVIQGPSLTLVSTQGGQEVLLGALVPNNHWIVSAG